jgi:hypothetical protein
MTKLETLSNDEPRVRRPMLFVIRASSFITLGMINQFALRQGAPVFFFTLRHRFFLSHGESFVDLADGVFPPGL